jgi:hypothetical protein
MAIVLLADLQRTYRARQNAAIRDALRRFLIDCDEPSAAAFRLVSQRLYVNGQIDNLGLTQHWLAAATIAERAQLYSEIATVRSPR